MNKAVQYKNFLSSIKKRSVTFLLLIFLFCNSSYTYATHLIGGDMSYLLLSGPDANNNYTYALRFVTYQDCNSEFWNPNGPGGFPEPSFNIGIYEGNLLATTLTLKQTINAIIIEQKRITPTLPPGCTVNNFSCVFEVVYAATFTVPFTLQGYHLYYDRCCRTGGVINLNNSGSQGDAYTAFIPPQIILNSSPIFSGVNIPYVCVGDTVTFVNSAIDPDGDLLIFSFVTPFRGYGTQQSPAPPLPGILTFPPPTVNYNPGYSATQPFGNAGLSIINGFTGITQLSTTAVGKYLVGVLIQEYRNGNLISVSRRNYQFEVLSCNPNIPPNLNSNPQTNPIFTIEEGDTLCMPVSFQDAENQAMNLNISGSIFSSVLTNPAASFTTPVQSGNTISSQVCWQTACGQGRSLPYSFTATATDFGCPPKSNTSVFGIVMQPFQGPSSIQGKAAPCPGETSVNYSVTPQSGVTYNWIITNGTQTSGTNTASINVDWGLNSTGNVRVIATSKNACNAPPIDLPIFLKTFTANAGANIQICPGDSVQIGGSPTAFPGAVINWSPNQNISSVTATNPIVFPDTTTTYVVSVADADGCLVFDTITVNVFDTSGVSAGNDTLLCSATSGQLNATGGTGYTWQASPSLSNTTIPNPIINLTQSETFVVTITSSNNCFIIDSVIVLVDTIPIADAGLDVQVCSGDSFNLGGSPSGPNGALFQWSPAALLNDATIANPVGIVNSLTNFILTVSTPIGCQSSDTVEVDVLPQPLATVSNDTLVCFGDTFNLVAGGGLNYSWSPGNLLNDSTLASPLVFTQDTTQFSVIVSDAIGCKDTATVLVSFLPRVLQAGVDLFLCPGNSVQLNAIGDTIKFWSPGNVLNDSTLASPTANPLTTTTFTVVATSSFGCTERDTLLVEVAPVIPTDAGINDTICFGDTSIIGGNPTTLGNVSVEWKLQAIVFDTTFNPLVTPTQSSLYILEATSGLCTGTDTVEVIVNQLPITNAGSNTAICFGDSIILNGLAPAAITQLWSPTATLSDSTLLNPIAKPLVQTTYFLQVTDSNLCSNIDSVIIDILALPIINTSNNDTVCRGDTLSLFATGGTQYSWIPGNVFNDSTLSNPDYYALDSNTVFVRVSDANNCTSIDSIIIQLFPDPQAFAGNDTIICIGDSIQLNASGGQSYQWLTSTFISNVNIANPVIFPPNSIAYVLEVTDANACKAMDTIMVGIDLGPNTNAGGNRKTCLNDTLLLQGSGANSYLWSPAGLVNNPFNPNTYTVLQSDTSLILTGFNTRGCRTNDTIFIEINPIPFINIGDTTFACKYQDVLLGGNPTAPGGSTYLWTPNENISNNTVANPIVNITETSRYFLTVIDTNSCKNSDTVNIYIFRAKTNVDVVNACEGDSFLVETTISDGFSPYRAVWQPGKDFADSTALNPIIFPKENATYTGIITDGIGCNDTIEFDIYPLIAPIAEFDYSLIPGCDGMHVFTENLSENGTDFRWKSGTFTSTNFNAEIVIPYSLTSTIQLEAISADTCKRNKEVSISTEDLKSIIEKRIGNVFTPNNDGVNDFFEVEIDNRLQNCTVLDIYNRWGQLMFSSYGKISHSWDGVIPGENPAPEGVYFYVLRVNDLVFKGSLSLFR
jgi:gliding motility-associated-like protein